MEVAVILLLVVATIGVVVLPYLMWRNNFILKYRLGVLEDQNFETIENLTRHAELPSYNHMLYIEFWKFDWSELLPTGAELNRLVKIKVNAI